MLSGNGTQSPIAKTALANLISQITKRSAGELSENARLDSDLNLSSLDRVELLSALEDRYHVDLSETRFSAVNTIGDLEGMLKGEAPPRAIYHYPAWVQRWPVTWIRFLVHYALLLPSVFVLGWPRIIGRVALADAHGLIGRAVKLLAHLHFDQGAFFLYHDDELETGGEALEALRTPPGGHNLFASIFDRIEWFLGVALLNIFPLPRDAGFRESFAFAGESVDRGYSVLVFPEGHHTIDGKMRPFRSGVGLLVNDLNIPVVPMRIDGLFEVKQAGKRMARPHQIKVRIGSPIRFNLGINPQDIAHQLRIAVEQL